jgi:hypothetical protein
VIRDLLDLRRYGRVRRRVENLAVSVSGWRAGVRSFARREGLRVRTGLVELLELSDPITRRVRTVPVVYAVRVDAPERDDGGAPGPPSRPPGPPSRWERPPAL